MHTWKICAVKTYLLILPIALLVTYSQIIVKWRTGSGVTLDAQNARIWGRLLAYLVDPVILSAYAAALLASFAWLFVVTKLSLTVAFPVYIGVTFSMVVFGGWFFLSEPITTTKIVAILLIFSGIVLGVKT